MREKFGNTDGIRCGNVCLYVCEFKSEIDQSWGISAKGKGFMMLAALIRSACEREKVRNVGSSTLRQREAQPLRCQLSLAICLKPVRSETISTHIVRFLSGKKTSRGTLK